MHVCVVAVQVCLHVHVCLSLWLLWTLDGGLSLARLAGLTRRERMVPFSLPSHTCLHRTSPPPPLFPDVVSSKANSLPLCSRPFLPEAREAVDPLESSAVGVWVVEGEKPSFGCSQSTRLPLVFTGSGVYRATLLSLPVPCSTVVQ